MVQPLPIPVSTLSGRHRFRCSHRFLRRPLVVLQVEVRVDHYRLGLSGPRMVIEGDESFHWRDATPEEAFAFQFRYSLPTVQGGEL